MTWHIRNLVSVKGQCPARKIRAVGALCAVGMYGAFLGERFFLWPQEEMTQSFSLFLQPKRISCSISRRGPPKVCRIMACSLVFRGVGPLFYLLLGGLGSGYNHYAGMEVDCPGGDYRAFSSRHHLTEGFP